MPRLALTKEVLKRFGMLDKTAKKDVYDAIASFVLGGNLRSETVSGAKDARLRLVHLAGEVYGVLLHAGDDLVLIVTIADRADATDIARNNRVTVNMVTGVLELRHETALEYFRSVLRREAERTPIRLFEEVTDDQLAGLGIDAEIAELVRLLVNADNLVLLQRVIPVMQYGALLAIASGMPYEQVRDEVRESTAEPIAAPVDQGDLAAAMRRTPSDVVIVDDAESWREIFDHPFDAWRIFLHPAQRALARRDGWAGPVLVTGGPGTGKTVTLLHRAHHLAKRYRGQPGRPVLIATYSRNLVMALRDQLRLLILDDEVRDRIEVATVDSLAYRIAREVHRRITIPDEPAILACWRAVRKKVQVPFTARFLHEEWLRVIVAGKIRTERDYLRVERAGRGRQLNRGQRRLVWRAVELFVEQMQTEGKMTYAELCDIAAEHVAQREIAPYRHVLVDEAQDMHPGHWRLLRALVASGADDMFLVGDAHQRIYAYQVSLASVDIDVRGRSRKLRLSYRTTQEILSWAIPRLGDHPIIGLSGRPEDLAGLYSPTNGRRPAIRRYDDEETELQGLVSQIKLWQGDGVELAAIGVASRSREMARKAVRALEDAGFPCVDLEEDQASEGLRVGTMHGMKGREFRCVAIIGVGHTTLPLPSAVTPAHEDRVVHERDMQQERCLLYVASTRARDTLYLSHSGAPSPFLED